MDAHIPDVEAVRCELEIVIDWLPIVRVLKCEITRNGILVDKLAEGDGK